MRIVHGTAPETAESSGDASMLRLFALLEVIAAKDQRWWLPSLVAEPGLHALA